MGSVGPPAQIQHLLLKRQAKSERSSGGLFPLVENEVGIQKLKENQSLKIMLIHTSTPAFHSRVLVYPGCVNSNEKSLIVKKTSYITRASKSCRLIATSVFAAAVVIASAAGAIEAPQEAETLSNIPQTLSGECASPKDCKKPRIQRPKSRKAESCTSKCVTTCIQGGESSPGEGPFNIRRPIVVFKQGFRSRQYCLVECSDICNLIEDGDDEP